MITNSVQTFESTMTKINWLVYSVEEEMHLRICNKITLPNQLQTFKSTMTKFDWLVYSAEEEMHLSICNKITLPKQLSFQGLQKNWPNIGLWD